MLNLENSCSYGALDTILLVEWIYPRCGWNDRFYWKRITRSRIFRYTIALTISRSLSQLSCCIETCVMFLLLLSHLTASFDCWFVVSHMDNRHLAEIWWNSECLQQPSQPDRAAADCRSVCHHFLIIDWTFNSKRKCYCETISSVDSVICTLVHHPRASQWNKNLLDD